MPYPEQGPVGTFLMHSPCKARLSVAKTLRIPLRETEGIKMLFSLSCKDREGNTLIRNLDLVYT